MCGIHGYLGRIEWKDTKPSRENIRDTVRDGFITNMVRGIHASGLFGVPLGDVKGEEPEVVKRAYNGLDFLGSEDANRLLNKHNNLAGYVAHVRHATRGRHHRDNAHPFQHGPVTMVHNGTLWNEKLLGEYGFETDSEYMQKSR